MIGHLRLGYYAERFPSSWCGRDVRKKSGPLFLSDTPIQYIGQFLVFVVGSTQDDSDIFRVSPRAAHM